MNWIDGLSFYEQDWDTQLAIYEALGSPAIEELTEPAGEGMTRTLSQVYQAEDIQVKVSYYYANPADSLEWGALKDFSIDKL